MKPRLERMANVGVRAASGEVVRRSEVRAEPVVATPGYRPLITPCAPVAGRIRAWSGNFLPRLALDTFQFLAGMLMPRDGWNGSVRFVAPAAMTQGAS